MAKSPALPGRLPIKYVTRREKKSISAISEDFEKEACEIVHN